MDTKAIKSSGAGIELRAQNASKFEPDSKEAKHQKIEKAAEQFEGMLLRQMTKSMWETTNIKGSLLGSKEEETYRDMYNELLSDELAKGQGIGIKGVIAKELDRVEGSGSSAQAVASKYKVK